VVKIINTTDIAVMTNLSDNETDWVYNGLDCCVTLEVLEGLQKNTDEISMNTYQFSLDLQAPILEMQLRGLLVDRHKWNEVLADNKKKIEFLSKNLTDIIEQGLGIKINWRSSKQLCSLFYDVLGLPEIKNRSKSTGKYGRTADREALEKLTQYYYAEPICNHLLFLRDYEKQRQFLETPLDKDGCFSSSYNIAGTNTGRLSSAETEYETGSNAQNIARSLRSCFRARSGYKYANLDLEQADSRNVGAICRELFLDSYGEEFASSYLDACESGDLHTYVCKMAWKDLPWTGDRKLDRTIADQIFYRDFTYRDMAKKLGHGTNYIGQPHTMAMHTKLPVQPIKDFQVAYFETFPCISAYHESVKYDLKHLHFLQTPFFNRRRFFFGRATDAKVIREAVAYQPQSMTGDEINTGILQLWKEHRVCLLAQVHDNILFEYKEEEEDEVIPWAIEALRVPMLLKDGREFIVPVEAKIGWNWGNVEYTDGKPSGNLHGLIPWKGKDTRTTPEYIKVSNKNSFSLSGIL